MHVQCCCQAPDPAWEDNYITWEAPRFFWRTPTRLFLHRPLTYNEDVVRAAVEAKTRGLVVAPRGLVLLKSGLFGGEVLLEVQPPPRALRDERLRALEGRFYVALTPAPWHLMGEELERALRRLRKARERTGEIFLCLLTCPACRPAKGDRTAVLVHLPSP